MKRAPPPRPRPADAPDGGRLKLTELAQASADMHRRKERALRAAAAATRRAARTLREASEAERREANGTPSVGQAESLRRHAEFNEQVARTLQTQAKGMATEAATAGMDAWSAEARASVARTAAEREE